MTDFGVTPDGFVLKPFADILNDKLALARALFGPDIDLHSTAALRQILDIASIEDHEHWKALEGAFYANFTSTGSGRALDLLGTDLGLDREFRRASGRVTFTLSGEAPGRSYVLPLGTMVETAAPPVRFRINEAITLSGTKKTATVMADAIESGVAGNAPKGAIVAINQAYASHFLTLGAAAIAVTNDTPFEHGDEFEADDDYRARLLRLPRTLFTVDAVTAAVLNVDGVRGCIVNDPSGGVDVALSVFKTFMFDNRRFGEARFLGTPYFFDILVAPQPGYLWDTLGGTTGLHDTVARAVDAVRPIGIFPNIRLANAVVVGVRATITIRPGLDGIAVNAALKGAFERRLSSLGLGGAVLAAEVSRDFMNVAGVKDVQNLHLRRHPPSFGTFVFGDRELFDSAVIEGDLGANLPLTPNEIATFQYDSPLIDLKVADR